MHEALCSESIRITAKRAGDSWSTLGKMEEELRILFRKIGQELLHAALGEASEAKEPCPGNNGRKDAGECLCCEEEHPSFGGFLKDLEECVGSRLLHSLNGANEAATV